MSQEVSLAKFLFLRLLRVKAGQYSKYTPGLMRGSRRIFKIWGWDRLYFVIASQAEIS